MAATILIGSTGNGKSALGNFILNPDEEHMYDSQYFVRAKDNIPCTQETKVANEFVSFSSKSMKKSSRLTVIDTPGLNESGQKDLEHMIGLVETLETVEVIQACLIVVKFDGKIDMQYKNTIKYYSKLLPALFEKNLVIVMTGFDCSRKAERKRKRDGIDVQRIQDNTVDEIVKICGFSFKPILFKIDSLPDEDDLEANLEVRDAMLSFIFAREGITITNFMIHKPDFLQTLDEKAVLILEREIKNEQLKVAHGNKALGDVMSHIGGLEKDVRDNDAKLSDLNADKASYDTSDKVDVEVWSVSKGWEFWSRVRDSFSISSEFPLREAETWDNGKCEWIDYKKTSNSVSGSLKAGVMRGLYASVTYKTYKRDKYASQLSCIADNISARMATNSSLKREIQMLKDKNSGHAVELERQKESIEKRREAIRKLAVKQLSIEDAKKRLEEIIATN